MPFEEVDGPDKYSHLLYLPTYSIWTRGNKSSFVINWEFVYTSARGSLSAYKPWIITSYSKECGVASLSSLMGISQRMQEMITEELAAG